MGESTKIQWTDHTFNPWRGCSKVHAGCANCYAERDLSVKLHGIKWGPGGTRVVASESKWREPIKWNKQAERDGVRRRVFCASLADVFEDWQGGLLGPKGLPLHHGKAWAEKATYVERDIRIGRSIVRLGDVRARLFKLIDATPWLDWQLLTKRPENVRRMWPAYQNDQSGGRDFSPRVDGVEFCGLRFENVWLGTSVSNQETADQWIPELLKLRDLVPVLFVSAEPIIGPIDLRRLIHGHCPKCGYDLGDWTHCSKCGHRRKTIPPLRPAPDEEGYVAELDWLIVGGESGHAARPCDIRWVQTLVEQCKTIELPCFVKQLGGSLRAPYYMHDDATRERILDRPHKLLAPIHGAADLHAWDIDQDGQPPPQTLVEYSLEHKKGGDPAEWPSDLVVRQFPQGH